MIVLPQVPNCRLASPMTPAHMSSSKLRVALGSALARSPIPILMPHIPHFLDVGDHGNAQGHRHLGVVGVTIRHTIVAGAQELEALPFEVRGSHIESGVEVEQHFHQLLDRGQLGVVNHVGREDTDVGKYLDGHEVFRPSRTTGDEALELEHDLVLHAILDGLRNLRRQDAVQKHHFQAQGVPKPHLLLGACRRISLRSHEHCARFWFGQAQ
ncbi:hypothetical protein M5D96_008845 [Drosophila gunungcola]|uniref:Uncharacterized protein n=1 Tax=Drosophila gunungcola TaxID=103775 RepID=A0A9P9YJN5_9MUSC|nr:hypothetical protein M5D96_008845 [Drosophila gunungcola]